MSKRGQKLIRVAEEDRAIARGQAKAPWLYVPVAGCVFQDLGFAPEEAADLRQRADLLRAIADKVRGWKVTQHEAARRLGVTEPCLADLLAGRVSRFSLDELTEMAERAAGSW